MRRGRREIKEKRKEIEGDDEYKRDEVVDRATLEWKERKCKVEMNVDGDRKMKIGI